MGWELTAKVPGEEKPWKVQWDAGFVRTSPPSLLGFLEDEVVLEPVVFATPTGPMAPADLAVGHVAYLIASRYLQDLWKAHDIRVEGRGWAWPADDPRPPGNAVF